MANLFSSLTLRVLHFTVSRFLDAAVYLVTAATAPGTRVKYVPRHDFQVSDGWTEGRGKCEN